MTTVCFVGTYPPDRCGIADFGEIPYLIESQHSMIL